MIAALVEEQERQTGRTMDSFIRTNMLRDLERSHARFQSEYVALNDRLSSREMISIHETEQFEIAAHDGDAHPVYGAAPLTEHNDEQFAAFTERIEVLL